MACRSLSAASVQNALDLKSVLSVVHEDMHASGAEVRLIKAVDVGSKFARPKLVGFHAPGDLHDCKWAIYLNRKILFDDKYHFTSSLARALIHLELVGSKFSTAVRELLCLLCYVICVCC